MDYKVKYNNADISALIGLTLTEVSKQNDNGQDEIVLKTSCGREFLMTHFQDCCEDVAILDIDQPLEGLCGSPILMAECITQNASNEYSYSTWTFYKIGNINGVVTIQWQGESNGYYNEEADFVEKVG